MILKILSLFIDTQSSNDMNSQTSIQNFSNSIIGSNGLNFVNTQLKAGVASNNLVSIMRKSYKASNSYLLFQKTVFKSLQENS